MPEPDGGRDRVLALLTESAEPLSMDDLYAATNLPLYRINEILCGLLLTGATVPVKVRRQGRMKTHYKLKARQ